MEHFWLYAFATCDKIFYSIYLLSRNCVFPRNIVSLSTENGSLLGEQGIPKIFLNLFLLYVHCCFAYMYVCVRVLDLLEL